MKKMIQRYQLPLITFVFFCLIPKADGQQALRDHVPLAASKLNLRPIGRLDSTNLSWVGMEGNHAVITETEDEATGNGSIRGKVYDQVTKDELPGATVLVKGTNIGAATDINGAYVVLNAPAGEQNIVVRYVGYVSLTAQVTVEEGQTVVKDFYLTSQAVTAKNVIVTAQAQGQMQSINQELAANQIVNIVSAEKMKELPDANIAESIGRLPGISLERNAGEAYAVVVRGLAPQYNEVTIEGIPMSSTSYQDRTVDLSLLGDNLVKGVEVSKTLQPNMDADALGGTINLTLKTADRGFHYDFWGNGGYNNLRDSYKNYKFSGSASDRFFDDKIGALLQGNLEEKQLPSDQFNATYATPARSSTVKNTFYINSLQAMLTDNNIERHRYGASLILDYGSNFVDVKLFNVYDQKNDNTVTRTNTTTFNNNSFAAQILVNDTKTEQETHSIQALFKLGGTELPLALSYTKADQHEPGAEELDFVEQLTTSPLPVTALIYGQPLSLMADMGVMNPAHSTFSYPYISNSDLTDEDYDAKIDWKVPFKFSDSFSGVLSAGGKFHSVRRSSVGARWTFDLQTGNEADRQSLINAIPFLTGASPYNQYGIDALYFVDPNYKRTSILGYPIGPGYDVGKLTYMMSVIYPAWLPRFYNDGPGDYNQNYDDRERKYAGYVMGELNIGSYLTIVPGARYQEERTDISAYHVRINQSNATGLDGPAPVLVDTKRDNPAWYPSVNIKYKATDNIQVLGAVYRSVSLPSFADIFPLVDLDDWGTVLSGNPILKPSTAWNYDLGTSVFSDEIGLFTVDLFYKDISNLIYAMQGYYPFYPYPIEGAPADLWSRLPAKSYYDTTWCSGNKSRTLVNGSIPMNDPSHAYLRGIEFSWQTHFWYLPGLLSGLVLDFNLSLMTSNQLYPYFKPLTNRFGSIDTLLYSTTGGALQDQPKAVYNVILGWDCMGFSARYSVRYQQLTLTSMDTQFGLESSYYDNVLLMDISLKQQVIDNLSIFANATNVNTHIDNYYFSHPTYTPNATTSYRAGNLPTSQQTYGWAAQLGVSFSY